jgi:CubicO group peptidase (beta-lactamase class C family)
MRRNPCLGRFGLCASLVILTAALSLNFAFAAAQTSASNEASLEPKVDALFAPWNSLNTPGAAVAVIKDGMVVYRKGFGCANLEYGIPITPSTVFHVASVSKQFTAMAITMLEAAGKLSADDDIRKYLPDMPDYGRTITIRNLLNHTSGIRDQWDLLVLSGWRMDDVITQDQILDLLRRQKELNFPPGSQFLYSNSGFTLLAEIVGRVSGKPFTDWTRENIFLPLGMTSTHFHLDHTEIVRDRAYSYSGDAQRGFKQSPLNYANVGATSLFTTVEDMANWLRNFEEKRVGGAAVLDKMATKGVLSNGTEIGYARGIEVGAYKSLKTIGHSGGDAGFRSHVLYFPDERFGVAVFSNLGSFDPGGLCTQIADIYLASRLAQPAAPSTASGEAAAKPALKPVSLPAKTLEECVGTYVIEARQLVRRIVLDKDKLFYVRSDDNKSELVPLAPAKFKMKDVPGDVYVDFSDKSGSRYNAYTVTEANGYKSEAKRIEPFVPTDAELKEYAGSYYSDELDTRYDLELRAGSLRIRGGHSEDATLAPLMKDIFAAGGQARVMFLRDGQGAISGFLVSTNRVLNLRFSKTKS